MNASRRESVLFVCTANQCRSPMAEALLRRHLGARSEIDVTSAGFLPGGEPCPDAVIDVMGEAGFDLSGHRSRQLSAEIVSAATLVVTMTRQHLIDLAVEFPSDWERSFAIKDLIDRAVISGKRSTGEPLQSWVSRVQGGRRRADLLYLPADSDIPDPIGKPMRAFRQLREQLTNSVKMLTELLSPL